jgi:hypothetical protein
MVPLNLGYSKIEKEKLEINVGKRRRERGSRTARRARLLQIKNERTDK